MDRTWSNLRRALLLCTGLTVASAPFASAALAERNPDVDRDRSRVGSRFTLFAGATMVADVNRWQCGLTNTGETCVDIFNSPTGSGGFWPKGTANQLVFNSGLQIAGRLGPDAGPWAGDTVAAYFFDARGNQLHGDPYVPFGGGQFFNSLDPVDFANWPPSAVVDDPELFNEALLGRNAVSQQDVYVAYWDANPAKLGGGREHPMGILAELRVMGWNFPAGNEDILYFIIKFTNITNDPQFQQLQENAFFNRQNALPDGGWAIDSIWASFSFDPDVANFQTNYSYPILPFNLGIAYSGTWQEDGWVFPPDIYHAPFANGTGFFGSKYLKSPTDPATGQELGLTNFTATLNAATGFPDPIGPAQLWRYLSGRINTALGDNPCNVATATAGIVCFLAPNQQDTRFDQSSGPFSLGPGQSTTIAVAFIAAAPVDIGPGLLIGGDQNPGIPPLPQFLADGSDQPNAIDSISGWVSHSDVDGNGRITQEEVEVIPGSMLGKALVAQAVFDNKFLLPFAPEPPRFFVVPSDSAVTIVWDRSGTEQSGDPFFDVASDPTSPLHDPNFRGAPGASLPGQVGGDVEGYRIYKGTREADLRLIAQFDYRGTFLVDHVGNRFASETGEVSDSGQVVPIGTPGANFIADPWARVIQVPGGGFVFLADSSKLVIQSDTAVTGEGSPFPPLTNTGVPFVFVDRDILPGFNYFYAVTAFDVNSLASGPSSLESARLAQLAQPRQHATNLVRAQFNVVMTAPDGTELNPNAPIPALDPVTGNFAGPQPPTNSLVGSAEIFGGADQVVQSGLTSFRLDSVVPQYYHEATYYFTGAQGEDLVVGPAGPLGEEDGTSTFTIGTKVPADTILASDLGLGAVRFAGLLNGDVRLNPVTFASGFADFDFAVLGSFFDEGNTSTDGGSIWFDQGTTPPADPALGSSSGALSGVTTIFRPQAFVNIADALYRRADQTAYHVFRAADIEVRWSATGVEVFDITHQVPVPFSPNLRASYGFLTDGDSNGHIDYMDALFMDPVQGGAGIPAERIDRTGSDSSVALSATPVLDDVDVDGDEVPDGTGFAMVINGETFIFQTASVPTSGTWVYRSYFGDLVKSGGSYTFTPKPRNGPVPGLSLSLSVDAPGTLVASATDLSKVHTVPDPYYVTSAYDFAPVEKRMKFVNLPSRATIRIYSLSGILVAVLRHDDPTGGGAVEWNLRNRNNQFVASGVYFYHVETPDGQETIKKFTVVQFAR